MSERYRRLHTAPTDLYTAGSPVVIAAGALLKDNQTGGVLAQLKFLNIQGKKIKALKVALEAFDIEGKPLEGVAEYQYLDFDAARDAEFGQKQAIPMPDAVTRSFRCRCTSVIFSDGTTWAAPADAVWEPMPKPVMPADYLGMDLAGQYIRDVGSAKMVPVVIGDLWRCTCGALNGSGEEKCHKCSKDKEHLFACLEKSGLEERKAAYDAGQARLAEEARLREEKRRAEEAARAEERRIAAEKKRRKQKKITIILLVLAILGAAAYFLVTELIIPTMEFNKGIDLLDQDEFLAAYEIMAPLGDFHDAKNLAAEYCYAYAVERFQHKDFITANKYLEAIGDYKDSQYYLHYRHEYTCTTTPAVCEVAGKYVYTCRCGNAYMESIPALEHVWKKADCYNPKTCTLCGKTEGEKYHGYWITPATCQKAAVCNSCKQEVGSINPDAHLLASATCVKGEYCTRCGEVVGEPNPNAHGTVSGATCTKAGICTLCKKTAGKPLGHSTIKGATCTKAGVCTRCNQTAGEPLGHGTIQGATCVKAGVCTRCNQTAGEPLGHGTIQGATCTKAGVCTRCNQTAGKALGHTGNNQCTRCNAFVNVSKEDDDYIVWDFTAPVSGEYRITLTNIDPDDVPTNQYHSWKGRWSRVQVGGVWSPEVDLDYGESISITCVFTAGCQYTIRGASAMVNTRTTITGMSPK